MKWLRALNSYQIFKIKIKNKKPIAVDVLMSFKASPMVPLSCRSSLARRYHEDADIFLICSILFYFFDAVHKNRSSAIHVLKNFFERFW
jgi:hypothetical protein